MLPELRDRDDARVIADKFLECLQQPFDLDGHEVHISASIGIAIYPGDGETIDELLRHADIAMYQVKAQGKNGHSFYHDLDARRVAPEDRARTEPAPGARARRAGDVLPAADRRASPAASSAPKALMRWNHPQRGLLSAGEFLPFAEENGLMLPISDWMIGALCRDMLQWNAGRRQPMRLSLNLSPQYLDRGDFFEKMRGALTRYGISPSADRSRDHREHLHPQSAVRDRAAQQAVPARRVGGDRRLRHRLFVAVLPAPLPDPHHQDRPVLRQGDPRRARRTIR